MSVPPAGHEGSYQLCWRLLRLAKVRSKHVHCLAAVIRLRVGHCCNLCQQAVKGLTCSSLPRLPLRRSRLRHYVKSLTMANNCSGHCRRPFVGLFKEACKTTTTLLVRLLARVQVGIAHADRATWIDGGCSPDLASAIMRFVRTENKLVDSP